MNRKKPPSLPGTQLDFCNLDVVVDFAAVEDDAVEGELGKVDVTEEEDEAIVIFEVAESSDFGGAKKVDVDVDVSVDEVEESLACMGGFRISMILFCDEVDVAILFEDVDREVGDDC